MSDDVVLILGGSDIATAAAIKAQEAGSTVYYACCSSTPAPALLDRVTLLPLDVSSHQSIQDAFKAVVAAHGRLDQVVLAFTPPSPSPSSSTAPGSDRTAVDVVVDPVVKASKCACHYLRRYPGRRVVFLAVDGPDVMARTTASAVLGIYRSIEPRFAAIGVEADLVHSDGNVQSVAAAAAALVSGKRASEKKLFPTVHIVRAGHVRSQASIVGQVHSNQYGDLESRLLRVIRIQESIWAFKIKAAKGELMGPLTLAAVAGVVSVALAWKLWA